MMSLEPPTATHKGAISPFLPSGKCRLCHFNVPPQWRERHLSSLDHKKKLAQGDKLVGLKSNNNFETTATLPPYHVECNICGFSMHHSKWSRHLSTPKHTRNSGIASLQTAIKDSERNKHDVLVSPQKIDFGLIDVETSSELTFSSKDVTVQAGNNTTNTMLSNVRLSSSREKRATGASGFRVSIVDSSGSGNYPFALTPRGTISITLKIFSFAQIGRYQDRLELKFIQKSSSGAQNFVITRPIYAAIGVKTDHKLLRPKALYVPKRRRDISHEEKVIPGVRPSYLENVKTTFLQRWDVPSSFSEVLRSGDKFSTIFKAIEGRFFPQALEPGTYKDWFRILLYLDEEQAHIDIQLFNDDNASLEPNLPYFRLNVPGLAEKRPSLVIGDRVLVRKKEYNNGPWYEGYVHRIHAKMVDLRFNSSFHGYKGQGYTVRFSLNRGPIKRMHQAIAEDFGPDRLFFPSLTHILGRAPPSARALAELRPFNREILKNESQKLAVAGIIGQSAGSVPFVIFGPPGTGKTVTIVESIRQLVSQANNRPRIILACAPSNSAADIIAMGLMPLGHTQLFRLVAPSRDPKDHPKELSNSSFVLRDAEGHFTLPTVKELLDFRVIVCTCVSSFWLRALGLPRGHFSHIFVDESGQACEPETIIPIRFLAGPATNVVLSGDPKQLGPIVRSKIARKLGMTRSYLERLISREPYAFLSRGDSEDAPSRIDGSGITIVKLNKNFRSHPAIIGFSNDRFYGGTLEACARKEITHSLLRSHEVRAPGFPVIFNSVAGKDMRESSSPSFFNIDEVSVVKRYIRALKGDRRLRLNDKDFGVISPYHAQCMKLGYVLKNIAPDVKVGSVEEFQGQERRIILISTVRSNHDFIEHDVKHALGFVANARRFNVAVTRAQALLIVIGDSRVLALDPLWRDFMTYIYVKGGWTGNNIHWDPSQSFQSNDEWEAQLKQERNATLRHAMEVIQGSQEIPEGMDDAEDANIDRPWREDE